MEQVAPRPVCSRPLTGRLSPLLPSAPVDVAGTVLRRTPERARPLVTLAVRTIVDAREDRVAGLAAEVAFFLILALPPLLLAVLGSVGYLGDLLGQGVTREVGEQLLTVARAVFSAETVETLIGPTVAQLLTEGRADIASLGVIVTLWSASRALHVLMRAIAIAYDLEDARATGWHHRLASLGGTVVAVVVGTTVALVLVAGPRLGERLAEPLGLSAEFGAAWGFAYWPVVVVIATAALTTLYHIGAPWKTPWRRDLPGAVLAVVLWMAGSAVLRLYAVSILQVDAVYSRLAAPLVLLLWLYVSSVALLLGAELNAEVEKQWPTRRAEVRYSA